MSCFNNKETQEGFEKLANVLGNENSAQYIIGLNNYQPLNKTRLGDNSVLFEQLKSVSDDDTALIAKSLLYAKPFGSEPSIIAFSKMVNDPIVTELAEDYAIVNDIETTNSNVSNELVPLDYDISEYPTKGKIDNDFKILKNVKDIQLKKLELEKVKLTNIKKNATNIGNKEEALAADKELRRITQEINRTQLDTKILSNEVITIDDVAQIANDELVRVKQLIVNDNIRMFDEGQDILNWYKMLGNFYNDENHPFFKHTRYRKKDIDPDTISKLSDIANKAESLLTDLKIKQKNKITKVLENNENFSKIFGESQYDLFSTKSLADIDFMSALFRSPINTYGENDTLLTQLAHSIYVDAVIDEESDTTALRNTIDAIYEKLAKKKNWNTNKFDELIQKDEYGGKATHLINPMNTKWDNKLRMAYRRLRADLKKAYSVQGMGTTTAYSNYYKNTLFEVDNDNNIKLDKNGNPIRKAEYLELGKLKAIQEFTTELLSDRKKYSDISTNTIEFENDKMDAYEKELRDRLGDYEFERIIEEQKLLIEQYFDAIQEDITIENLDSGNDLNYEQNKLNRIRKKAFTNPFLSSKADNTGRLKFSINNKSYSNIVNGQYAVPIPTKESANEYVNKDFRKLEKDDNFDGLLFELWKELTKGASYFNSVAIANSKNVNHLRYDSLPLLQDRNFRNLWKYGERFKNRIRVDQNYLDRTKNNKKLDTDINTANLKSLEAKLNSETRGAMTNILAGRDSKEKGQSITVTDNIVSTMYNIFPKDVVDTFLSEFKDENNILDYSDLYDFTKSQLSKDTYKDQSKDLVKNIKYAIDIATGINAARKALPEINMIKTLMAELRTDKGKERTKSLARYDAWVDRKIKGFRDNKQLSVFPQGSKSFMTKVEKKKYKNLEKQLEILGDEASGDIEAAKAELRRPVNVMAAFGIIHEMIVKKSMMFNWVSGAFNRAYGVISNGYADAIGLSWTSGNYIKARRFMSGKFGQRTISKVVSKKDDSFHNETKKMRLFFNNVRLHQDLRDDYQKADKKLGKEDWKKKTQWAFLSITMPEYYNQGEIILSILQDYTIKGTDKNGNPIEVQLFDGKGFPAYNIVDNKLVLKDEFRTPDNIKNWENHKSGGSYAAFYKKSNLAIVNYHGEYSFTGGMMAKDYTLPAMLMTFKTYIFEQYGVAFDKGIKLDAGIKTNKSIFENSSVLTRSIYGMIMGLIVGGPLGILGAGMMAGGSAYFLYKNRNELSANYTHKALGAEVKRSIQEMRLLVEELIAMPVRLIGYDLVSSQDKLKKRFDSGKGEQHTKEILASSRFYIRKLAVLMYTLASIAAVAKSLDCNDDTYACKKKKFYQAFLINKLTRIGDDLILTENPVSLFSNITSMPAIDFWGDLLEFIGNDLVWLFDAALGNDHDIMVGGINSGRQIASVKSVNFLSPSIAKEFGMFENKPVGFETFTSGIPGAGIPKSGRRIYDDYNIKDMVTSPSKLDAYNDKQKQRRAAYKRELLDQGYTAKTATRKANKKYPNIKKK